MLISTSVKRRRDLFVSNIGEFSSDNGSSVSDIVSLVPNGYRIPSPGGMHLCLCFISLH